MAKIIKFKQKHKANQDTDSFTSLLQDMEKTAKKMQLKIEDTETNSITRLEAKMLKSIMEFDDNEFDRTSTLLSRIRKAKITTVK